LISSAAAALASTAIGRQIAANARYPSITGCLFRRIGIHQSIRNGHTIAGKTMA
jgi:hypothetical protein